MYSLKEVFEQAKTDTSCLKMSGLGYESVLARGLKIVKDDKTGYVEILNTMVNGSYYAKLNPHQLNIFLEEGWKCGMYNISLSNYRSKLDSIEYKIKDEITGRNSEKQLLILKGKREVTLRKYTEIKNKLNSIQNAYTKEIKSGE